MRVFTTIYIVGPKSKADIELTKTFENSVEAQIYENKLHEQMGRITHRITSFPRHKHLTVDDVNSSRIFEMLCAFDLAS